MLRNYKPEMDRDIIFIPVGINYDRTLEDRSLRFQEVAKLADQLMAAIKKVIPILPISLVSTVIKDEDRQGLSASEVESQTNRLIEALRLQGAPLYFTTASRVETMINALNMLTLREDWLWKPNGFYKPVDGEYDVLAYYANSIVHRLPDGQKHL